MDYKNKLNLLYRNFHFIYADYRVAWIIPLLGGVRGGFLGREISVHPVRKCGRVFKPLPHYIFSNSALSDGDSFLTGRTFHELLPYPPLIPSQEGTFYLNCAFATLR